MSRLGFGTRARTWIARFRVSRPANWTIPKLRRSGGSRTRAARSKNPACRLNTSDRRVGPEGVKPSPHRVKAGHASLHFDPVLLSLSFCFFFALHGHTSPVERTRALHTPLVWARLELNQLVRRPGVYSAGRFPETIPGPLKRRKPPRLSGRLHRGKTL